MYDTHQRDSYYTLSVYETDGRRAGSWTNWMPCKTRQIAKDLAEQMKRVYGGQYRIKYSIGKIPAEALDPDLCPVRMVRNLRRRESLVS